MRLTVTGGESSLSRTLTYNVSSVEASISAVNFNAADVYTGNVNFQYRCMGRGLQKTVYFYIDGDLYASEEIGTSHNETKTKLIEMMGNYEYGAHDLVVYFQTPDGAKGVVTAFDIRQSVQSWKSHIRGLAVYHTMKRLDELIFNLFGTEVIA